MAKRAKKPKYVLKLPDLDYSKSAVLNSLPSLNSRRSYEHAIRDFIDRHRGFQGSASPRGDGAARCVAGGRAQRGRLEQCAG